MVFAPLPVVDEFLRSYNLAQITLLLLILAAVGNLVVARSMKLLGLNLLAFGLLFLALPGSTAPYVFRVIGIVLIVLGPMLFTTR